MVSFDVYFWFNLLSTDIFTVTFSLNFSSYGVWIFTLGSILLSNYTFISIFRYFFSFDDSFTSAFCSDDISVLMYDLVT